MFRVPDSLPAVLPWELPFDELSDDGSVEAIEDSFEVVEAAPSPPEDDLLKAPDWQAAVSRSRGFHRKPVDPDFHALCGAAIALSALSPECPSPSRPEQRDGGSDLRAAARKVIGQAAAYLRGPGRARSIDRINQARALRTAALARAREHLDGELHEARLSSSGVSLVNAYKSHAMYCLDFFGKDHLPAIKDDLEVRRYDFRPLALDPSPLSQDLAPAACRMLLRESLAQILREETHAPGHPACLPVFIPELGHGVLSIHRGPRDKELPLTQQIAVLLNLVAPVWTSDGRPFRAGSTIMRPSLTVSRLRPELGAWLRTLDVDALHDRLRKERDRIGDVLTLRTAPLPAAVDSSNPQSLLSDEQLRWVADRLRRLKTVVEADAVRTLADLAEAFEATAPARVDVASPASPSQAPSPTPSDSNPEDDDDELAEVRKLLNQKVPPDLYKLTMDDLTDSDASRPPSPAAPADRSSSMDSHKEPRL